MRPVRKDLRLPTPPKIRHRSTLARSTSKLRERSSRTSRGGGVCREDRPRSGYRARRSRRRRRHPGAAVTPGTGRPRLSRREEPGPSTSTTTMKTTTTDRHHPLEPRAWMLCMWYSPRDPQKARSLLGLAQTPRAGPAARTAPSVPSTPAPSSPIPPGPRRAPGSNPPALVRRPRGFQRPSATSSAAHGDHSPGPTIFGLGIVRETFVGPRTVPPFWPPDSKKSTAPLRSKTILERCSMEKASSD